MSALCDGINDCGFGNDETTTLCESQSPPLSVSIANFSFALQTSVDCHIMGAAPTLESVLHQSLMSTVETASQDSSQTLTTVVQLQSVLVSKQQRPANIWNYVVFITYCNGLWSAICISTSNYLTLSLPDIDECASRPVWYYWRRYTRCGPRGWCVNTEGSFTCLCLYGYTWNGHRCTRESVTAASTQ